MTRNKIQLPIRSRSSFVCSGCLRAFRLHLKTNDQTTATHPLIPRQSPSSSSPFSIQAQKRFQSGHPLRNHAGKPKSHRTPRTIFSGIQPTGVPHIGNYLGAIRPWVELQYNYPPDTKIFYSVVDLHSLTASLLPDDRRKYRNETVAALLASGIDPDRSILFRQSAVGGFIISSLQEGLRNQANNGFGSMPHRLVTKWQKS